MSEWIIEPFERSHDRSGFVCGKPPLDDFLRKYSGQSEQNDIGRTFVATKQGSRRVLGYYTLAANSIAYASLPHNVSRKLPKHSVPVVLLGRLAVEQSVQGQGLGQDLLIHAFREIVRSTKSIGATNTQAGVSVGPTGVNRGR